MFEAIKMDDGKVIKYPTMTMEERKRMAEEEPSYVDHI
jgi:hypothetical protein